MTIPKIAMLSNPLSQRNRRGMGPIDAVLARRPDIRHVRFEPGMDLRTLMTEFAEADIGLIVLNSGDGLVHAVLGALFLGGAFAVPPPLALLPRGMTNMTAADVGLGGRSAGTLRRLLDVVERGELSEHLVRRSVLKVEYDPDRPGERGMFFGAAGVYDAIHLCTGSIHTRGLTGSWASTSTFLTILSRALLRGVESTGIGGDEIAISIDGGPWTTGRRALALATTLDRLVLGTRPFWNNGDAPIHFTVFDHPAVGVVRHAWTLLFGGRRRHLPEPPFHSRSGHRVELRLDRPFTIDGEFFRAAPNTPIVISADEEIRYVKLRP